MFEEPIVWTLFGVAFTPYEVITMVGALLGAAVFCALGRKLKAGTVVLTLALAVPLALLGARSFYVLARWGLFEEIGFQNFFRAENPDYAVWGAAKGGAFWGAVGGGALAALLAGKITREKVSRVLDAMAPAAALALAVSRFGENSIGEGIGPDVSSEALWFFPVATVNEWSEWKYAVFLLEGLVALVIFLVLALRKDRFADGYRTRAFLVSYSASQIILEALRRDNFLRWLFVRVSQVTAAVVLLGLFVFGVLRWRKKTGSDKMPARQIVSCGAVFLALAGAIVWLEFAVDKSPDMSVALAYLLEGVCACGMGVTAWHVAMKN